MGTDLKISGAPAASALAAADLLPCAQGGASKATTPAAIAVYVGPNLPTFILLGGGSGIQNSGGGIEARDATNSSYTSLAGSVLAALTATAYKSKLDALAGVIIATGAQFLFSSASSLGGVTSGDVGVARSAAAVARISDGSTGIGALEAAREIEASTAGVASPNLLQATESRKALTNEGAVLEAYNTLPSAAAGYEFVFICQAAAGIRVVANTGDTIRMGGSVSASGGFIRSVVVGSTITLTAINATEWIAIAVMPTWTVDI